MTDRALPPVKFARPDASGDDAATGWQALRTFGLYRVLLAVMLAGGFWGITERPFIGTVSAALASGAIILYFVTATALLWLIRLRKPPLQVQITLQVLIDAIAIICIMHASGGIRSGLGILLLVPIAASSLITRGRMVYFHAAIAVIGLLGEQVWQLVFEEATAGELFQAGLLAFGYFAIAALTSSLAKYATGAERIAAERGVDLANLSQINELVIRDMQDGFLVVDERGVIRQHNAQCEAILGALAGRERLAEYSPRLAITLEEWRYDPGRVFPVTHDAATQMDYQVRFVAVAGTQRDMPAPTVIFLEDAGRIRAQAQQMKLVALGRLTASIAHEIRNPLSSINHAAELLLEETGREAGDARLLRIIRDNAHRLDRMVQEVLYLNRRDRAQPEAVDGSSYLREFSNEFSASEKVPAEAISFEVKALRRLWFDRTHLDQVLWNLTRNAWRHSRKLAGSIRIVLDTGISEEVLRLEVHDDGPGVATSSLPHLFEPFFTTDSQGTGLGLYIARELSEVNGARLDYVPMERGACFRLTLRAASS